MDNNVTLVEKAPAKINWFLFVCGKRSDGYHEILSAMNKITVFDTITMTLSKKIEIRCDNKNIPEKINLAYKGVNLFKERTGYNAGVIIDIKKEIPMGAGLGGGSADGAYTLMGLNKLWQTNISSTDLHEMASSLGSDMPFFLGTNFAFIEGRGERVLPEEMKESFNLLLIKPDYPISSGSAYKMVKQYTNMERDFNGKELFLKQFMETLNRRDYKGLSYFMKNDLSKAIYESHPDLLHIEQQLLKSGAKAALLSGSGSTVFGVYEDDKSTEKAYHKLKAEFSHNWIKMAATQPQPKVIKD